jgi:hypothetical protein
MFRQLFGKLHFETGQFAVIALEAERRIGSFQPNQQRAALFDFIQQIFAANVFTLMPATSATAITPISA